MLSEKDVEDLLFHLTQATDSLINAEEILSSKGYVNEVKDMRKMVDQVLDRRDKAVRAFTN